MGIQIARRATGTWIQEDQRWLKGGQPVAPPDDILLDVSGFTEATHYPNGFIPSGLLVAKVTATGLYVPYVGDNESVSIAVDATGGTFTITVEGVATAAIAYNATAAAVQAALLLLPGLTPGDLTVSGGPGNAGGTTPYVITWGGQYAGLDAPAVTTGAGSLTGGAGTAAVTTTAGGGESPAGEGTAAGLLFVSEAVVDGAGDIASSMVARCDVITNYLPLAAQVDAAARAALPHVRWHTYNTAGAANTALTAV